MSVSICCESISKSVSLFHTQFALACTFVLRIFSLTLFIKFFLIQNQSLINYRLKYYDFLSLEKKYLACNLSLEQFSWGAVFLRAICQSGNYVDGKSSERQFSSWVISRGILSRCNYLRGNFPGAIIQGQSSRGQLLGVNCPDNFLCLLFNSKLSENFWELFPNICTLKLKVVLYLLMFCLTCFVLTNLITSSFIIKHVI